MQSTAGKVERYQEGVVSERLIGVNGNGLR